MVVLPAQKLRILSWNILHGEQIPPVKKLTSEQRKNNLISAANEISQDLKPDFIGLQEVDLNQNRSGNINQTKLIAESMGLKYWAYIPTLIGTPGEKWKKVDENNPSLIYSNFAADSSSENTSSSTLTTYGIGFATNLPIRKIHFKYLGKSFIGLPLAIPSEGKGGARFIYVKDEPRVALIAELENGVTITTTHLSFAPGVNLYQLGKLSKFLSSIPGKHILIGDLNLPSDLPSKLSSISGGWFSLIKQNTYPSWQPKIQFDYLLAKKNSQIGAKELTTLEFKAKELSRLKSIISDHIPIGAEITFN